jgi:hypothetical protein
MTGSGTRLRDATMGAIASSDLAAALVLEGGFAIRNVYGLGVWVSDDVDFTLDPRFGKGAVSRGLQSIETALLQNLEAAQVCLVRWRRWAAAVRVSDGVDVLRLDITRVSRPDSLVNWNGLGSAGFLRVHSKGDLAAGKVAALGKARRCAPKDLHHMAALAQDLGTPSRDIVGMVSRRLLSHSLTIDGVLHTLHGRREQLEALWLDSALAGAQRFCDAYEATVSWISMLAGY